ncbi:MAG: 2-oxo acid dehydrogenase subunit E2 [Sphingomonadales bacterium]|nr:2-oxo acid dehydrogenase subunit E2 [Sphingomonadales bacterium]
MARFELIMPKMGESITEATVLKWLKQDGDRVAKDEAVLEIATDKVDSEVPTPVGGTLVQMLHAEGTVVKVGAVLAILETQEQGVPDKITTLNKATSPAQNNLLLNEIQNLEQMHGALSPVSVTAPLSTPSATTGRFYSPLVLNIASQEHIPMSELEKIPGTGEGGRLTKKDILSYLTGGRALRSTTLEQATHTAASTSTITNSSQALIEPIEMIQASSEPAVMVQTSKPSSDDGTLELHGVVTSGSVEIIEMDRMRKLIADNMIASKRISAHVTSFVEADVTNLHYWREEHKGEFEKRYNEKLTFTPMFVEAVVKAIQDFPMINVSVDGTRILKHKEIHIGMAAALPSGNLIVPVIQNADQLNLVGITKRVNDLANRARMGKLRPEEIQGGTFTLSNVGTFGNVMGTPIIAQPQVAILAVGAIRKRPAVIETPQGDFIGIRYMMFLSHSYDHRVVDGALGGMFVKRVAEYLESWDSSRGV